MADISSLGIYIHVPFCGKKCSYCNFYSVKYSKDLSCGFVDAVLRNIRFYAEKSHNVDTIYFGGGTPSLLAAEHLGKIIGELKNNFTVETNAEITVEANPNTVNFDKLSGFRKAGINRISFGVQSLSDSELKLLGRTHTAERAKAAVKDAQNAGFENISCDLMIAIPDQTAETMYRSIDGLAKLGIRHISSYILKIEENTPFCLDNTAERMPGDDEIAELYIKMVSRLEQHGFMQYEISNFAAEGFESRHNTRYWKCLDYIGIGPSAHSCCGGTRFAAKNDLEAFIKSDVQPVITTDESPCGLDERIMLSLRLKRGLDLSETGKSRCNIEKKIPDLIKAGYAEYDGNFLSLTPKGFLMSNSVIGYIIDAI